AIDGMRLAAALATALYQDGPLNAAVDDAHGDAFPAGAGIAQQPLRRQQREHLIENAVRVVRRRRIVHGRASSVPVLASRRDRKSATSRMQWRTAGGPCRTAKTRIDSARRRVSSASMAAPGPPLLNPSRSRSSTAGGGGASRRSAGVPRSVSA